MATTTAPRSAAPGGSFLIESPQPEDVFTPAELTDDQRLIGQTAEEFVAKEVLPLIPDLEQHKEGLMAGLLKKAGELGLLGGGVPEEYGGSGLDRISSTLLSEKISSYASFSVSVGAHSGIGTLAHRLFRHRRAEAKISAEDCHRRMARLLLPFGAAGRFRRAGLPHARRAFARRQALGAQRPEDVDHQRRLCRRLHRLRQSGRREILLLHRGARLSRFLRRRRREKNGPARQLHRADLF